MKMTEKFPDAVEGASSLSTAADLGKMYDEAFAEWQADEDSVEWESLDQTDWGN